MTNETFEVTPEIARFRQSQVLRDGLAAALENPVVAQALQAVMSLATPRSIPANVPGVHHDTTIAHQFYHHLGVVKVASMLHFMTTDGGPLGDKSHPEQEDFVHGLPPELQVMPPELKAKEGQK